MFSAGSSSDHMPTLKCPHCGMEFTAETEEEAKRKMSEHGMERHVKEMAKKE
jgi:transposase-like protein